MVNFTADFGNTFSKAALYAGSELIEVRNRLSDEELIEFLTGSAARKVMLCDVRGRSADFVRRAEATGREVHILDYRTPLPIRNLYQSPETLGADRLAAAVGAWAAAPARAQLIVDAGSCITYDFLTEKGEYLGGLISPGLQMRFRAMHVFTGKLPEMTGREAEPVSFPGQTTESSLRAGVQIGLEGEWKEVLRRYREKYGDFALRICGGDADFFVNRTEETIFANENPVLDGLNALLLFLSDK